MESLDQLAQEWAEHKAREDKAREDRIKVEERICALHKPREEGSESFATSGGYKIKLTGKLSYKADLNLLQVLTSTWPDDAKPIKVELKADETKLKAIRANAPKVWAQIAQAVEVKPAKTGVTIEYTGN
jgi:hypothetical protein